MTAVTRAGRLRRRNGTHGGPGHPLPPDERVARIARALDATQKGLAIEMALGLLRPLAAEPARFSAAARIRRVRDAVEALTAVEPGAC